jgi:hypothetical protein
MKCSPLSGRAQAQKRRELGRTESGLMIIAHVNRDRVADLLGPDGQALNALIRKASPTAV